MEWNGITARSLNIKHQKNAPFQFYFLGFKIIQDTQNKKDFENPLRETRNNSSYFLDKNLEEILF